MNGKKTSQGFMMSCPYGTGVVQNATEGTKPTRRFGRMKTYIHINQHVIQKNNKTGQREPPITVKTWKSNEYGHGVQIDGPCTVIYTPDKPLSCGARVWIETKAGVRVF